MVSIPELFRAGGLLMWVNLVVLAFALAVVSERLFVLTFRLRVNHRTFLATIERLVMAGNIDRALKLCASLESAAVPQVVKAALQNYTLGSRAVGAAIDEAMTEVMPRVTKRSGILWGIANLATLIGLVGTVLGLIESFAAVGLAAPDQKAILLTEGISHAMSNTFFGLAIAVTCVFFHMIVTMMTRSVLDSLDHAAAKMEYALAKRRLSSGARDASATPAPVAEQA